MKEKLQKILSKYYIVGVYDLEKELMRWAKKEVEKYIVHKASGGGYFKRKRR